MQEHALLYFDQYDCDLVDEGKQVEEPHIYTVVKAKSKCTFTVADRLLLMKIHTAL